MQAKSVKEVLKAAHWILTHLAWTKGVYFRDKDGQTMVCVFTDKVDYQRRIPEHPDQLGACCMVGAIELVETTPRLRHEAITFLMHKISSNPNYASITLDAWNDKSERTKGEVLVVLKRAIKEAP